MSRKKCSMYVAALISKYIINLFILILCYELLVSFISLLSFFYNDFVKKCIHIQ